MKKKFRFFPIAGDGYRFIIAFGVFGAAFLMLSPWFAKAIGILLLSCMFFSMAFFRDGERQITETNDILSPADGTVFEVATIDGEGYGQGRVVRIFLSVFDGHVQRSPMPGTVKNLNYQPGLFLDARDPRAQFENESNAIEITSDKGRILVKQIAGLIARRIVCWVKPEEQLDAGERLGLIRYGSQVDLYVPMDMTIAVKAGDKVMAGQTIMAQWPVAKASQEKEKTASISSS